jgi:two-component system LytT family sensor kinase
LKNLIQVKNAYLHSQINRHLLYNTLTFIYNSVFRIAPDAGKIVILLSDTMQYALEERVDGLVALNEEIGQIERYIELNELRHGHQLKLKFEKQVDGCEDVNIPPLLLLNFVENIFKHGNLVSFEEDAQILIICRKDILMLHTENYKKGWSLPTKHKHIGIANARTRLESYYGMGNFDLTLCDTDEKFIVDLNIRL